MLERSLLLLPCFVVLLNAQDHGSVSSNPFTTQLDAEAGAISFRAQCASCHGADAGGGSVGPSLTSGTFRHGGSDEALFRTITSGVPGTAMVGFTVLGREVWQIITFLRATNIEKAAGKAPGNAAKGAATYAANGRAACHTIGFKGGFTGPDLSEIGSRRNLTQLERSIIDADADVDAEYWSVRASTKSGQAVTGIRMNEDMDSLQIRDPGGKLRSFRKADLAKYEVIRTSPMPSFKAKLSANEVQDLVAYLASLRARPAAEESAK